MINFTLNQSMNRLEHQRNVYVGCVEHFRVSVDAVLRMLGVFDGGFLHRLQVGQAQVDGDGGGAVTGAAF